MVGITNGNGSSCTFMGESSQEIFMAVFESVSDALDTPIEELPPLSQSIDPDGLDALITRDQSYDVTVIFSYAGLQVIVHSDHTVDVRPLQSDGTDHPGTVQY